MLKNTNGSRDIPHLGFVQFRARITSSFTACSRIRRPAGAGGTCEKWLLDYPAGLDNCALTRTSANIKLLAVGRAGFALEVVFVALLMGSALKVRAIGPVER